MVNFTEEGHVYEVQGQRVPSVTQLLTDMGLVKPYLGDSWYGLRGTAVHRATELMDAGTLDPSSVDPAIAGFLDAYAKFRAETNMEWEHTEKRIYHSVYRFAGCVDRAVPVVDIKSGATACELQLSAYQLLLRDAGIDPGRTGYFLYLKEDGSFRLAPYKFNRRDDGIFLAAVSLWWYRKEKNLI